jgi:REP-associated tyrosine transposase
MTKPEQLCFFNPYAETRQTENRLPHWQQTGAVYFITFRLADSIPAELRRDWERDRQSWLRFHPQPWSAQIEGEYHKNFSGTVERWLDAGHGSCLLRRRECAQIVGNALRHFDGNRYAQISWVVMPNHVHCLLVPREEWPLEKVLHSWKRFSARSINHLLNKTGSLWQTDYFDRLVRDSNHLANCVRYIRNNPKKARMSTCECIHYEGEIARAIE